MKKVPGVESVDVSLNKGEAFLRLKPRNSVTIEEIRQVVIDSGFTPKGADAEVLGTIVERHGKRMLAVAGSDLIYLLVEHPRAKGRVDAMWKKARGQDVVIRGHLPETTTKGRAEEPKEVEVMDFDLHR